MIRPRAANRQAKIKIVEHIHRSRGKVFSAKFCILKIASTSHIRDAPSTSSKEDQLSFHFSSALIPNDRSNYCCKTVVSKVILTLPPVRAWEHEALFSTTEETASIPTHTTVTSTAIMTPRCPFRQHFSGFTIFNRCQERKTEPLRRARCSNARSAEPPQSSLFSQPSFWENLISLLRTEPSEREALQILFFLGLDHLCSDSSDNSFRSRTRKHAIIMYLLNFADVFTPKKKAYRSSSEELYTFLYIHNLHLLFALIILLSDASASLLSFLHEHVYYITA